MAKPVLGLGLRGWVSSWEMPTAPVRRKSSRTEPCAGLLPPASEGRQQGCFSHFWGVSGCFVPAPVRCCPFHPNPATLMAKGAESQVPRCWGRQGRIGY